MTLSRHGLQIDGRAALVTGASSGIGRAIALEFAARGARLVVSGRREHLLRELADDVAARGLSRPVVFAGDIGQRETRTALVEAATSVLGPVEVLVNAAGGGAGGVQWSLSDGAVARDAFEVNYWAPVSLAASLVPAMRAAGSGAVVNVTSMSQVSTWPMFGGYAATKAALAIATETLRLELSGSGVQVLEVVSGPVDTAVQAETRLIPGIGAALDRLPLGRPDELARLVVQALERGRPTLVYPRSLALAYAVPGPGRRLTRRQAARALSALPVQDRESLFGLVVRTGSQGDEAAREARAAWERAAWQRSAR